jgi:hypothetical protein
MGDEGWGMGDGDAELDTNAPSPVPIPHPSLRYPHRVEHERVPEGALAQDIVAA